MRKHWLQWPICFLSYDRLLRAVFVNVLLSSMGFSSDLSNKSELSTGGLFTRHRFQLKTFYAFWPFVYTTKAFWWPENGFQCASFWKRYRYRLCVNCKNANLWKLWRQAHAYYVFRHACLTRVLCKRMFMSFFTNFFHMDNYLSGMYNTAFHFRGSWNHIQIHSRPTHNRVGKKMTFYFLWDFEVKIS